MGAQRRLSEAERVLLEQAAVTVDRAVTEEHIPRPVPKPNEVHTLEEIGRAALVYEGEERWTIEAKVPHVALTLFDRDAAVGVGGNGLSRTELIVLVFLSLKGWRFRLPNIRSSEGRWSFRIEDGALLITPLP